MKLVMTGHNTVRVRYVSEREVLNAGGNSKGYFDCYKEWKKENGKLIVTFRLTILINKALDRKTLKDVEAHEQQHFRDFKTLAEKFKRDLEKVLAAGKDPEIEARLDWLDYDRCLKAAAFHRNSAGYSVDICFKPSSKRPQ